MLNKEDRQFIIQFVTQALNKGLGDLKQNFQDQMVTLKDGLRDELRGEIKSFKTELQTEIRHVGVYIEAVYDEVTSLAESVSQFNHRTDRLEADLVLVQREVATLPAIRSTVKKHSRQLADFRSK